MSRLDPSSAFAPKVLSGGTYDATNIEPSGIAGIYPCTDGLITFTDEALTIHTDIPVVACVTPPIRGKINITATTADLLLGLN